MGESDQPPKPPDAADVVVGGVEMDGDELAAELCDRGYPLHLIPHLNRWVVRYILRKPKNREGYYDVRPKAPPVSHRDQFFARWRKHGFEDRDIAKLWADHLKWLPKAPGVQYGRPRTLG